MASVVRAPHATLAPYVHGYVGYHDRLEPEAVHHGLPSPTVTVIVALDEPLDCGWLASPGDHTAYWLPAAGLHTEAALIHTHGFQHGIQLELTPLGVRALLGVPAAAIVADVVEQDELPLGLDAATHERIARRPDWEGRFALLDRALLGVLGRHESDPAHRVSPEVRQAWRLLEASEGRARIGTLAERVGWSRSRLVGRFGQEYGVTPKQAARLFRFDHARRLLDRGLPLAATAAEAGFADQAHLTREWRAMSGRTPTATLRSPYTFLQDDGATGGASSSA